MPRIVLFVLWAVITMAVPPGMARAEGSAAIHLHIFSSKTCPHCELIERKSLDKLQIKHRCEIVSHYHDLDDLEEYKRLVALEKQRSDTGNDLPVVFLGAHVLGGTKEIEARLPGLLDKYSSAGAPEIDVPTREAAAALLSTAATAGGPVALAYFEEPGCRQCARADRMLTLAVARRPNVQVRRHGLGKRENHVLLEALCERAGVPADRRLLTPAVFVGSRALVREDLTDAALEQLCAAAPGGASAWEITPAERHAAEERLWKRARGISLLAVAAGGLIDGINPCAFATLVFFVCCLAGAGRDRRTLAMAGGGFTAGVFAAYFAAGIGLSEALLRLQFLPRASAAVGWIAVALTLLLALLSLWDFGLAVRGRTADMQLKLPHRVRMRINMLIARNLRTRSALIAGVGLGAGVSLLEFVCTGQVYLPLIRYMTSVSGTRWRGIGLLLLYNGAFILPLLAVFAACFFGLRSERLLALFQRHVPLMKLLLCVFFTALGILMLHMQLRGAL